QDAGLLDEVGRPGRAVLALGVALELLGARQLAAEHGGEGRLGGRQIAAEAGEAAQGRVSQRTAGDLAAVEDPGELARELGGGRRVGDPRRALVEGAGEELLAG